MKWLKNSSWFWQIGKGICHPHFYQSILKREEEFKLYYLEVQYVDQACDRAGHISSHQKLGNSPILGPCKCAEICMCLNLLGLYLNLVLIQSLSWPDNVHLREISIILFKAQRLWWNAYCSRNSSTDFIEALLCISVFV